MVRRSGIGIAAVLLAAGAALCGAADPEPEPEAEREALRRQVDTLVSALAAARSEIDLLKVRLAEREFGRSGGVSLKPAETMPEVPVVLDANRELRMVALDKGFRQGVRMGMEFGVMQEERSVARVRVVDVRATLAGAVILRSEGRGFPKAGDRLLQLSGPER